VDIKLIRQSAPSRFIHRIESFKCNLKLQKNTKLAKMCCSTDNISVVHFLLVFVKVLEELALESNMKKTMYEKIWDSHFVHQEPGQAPLLYVDRHLMHEVTSPQAFEGLRMASRPVRNPHSILATMDHCVPTKDRDLPIADPIAKNKLKRWLKTVRLTA